MSPDILYRAGICLIAGATLYSELADRCPTDDPLGDASYGDWPFVPTDDFKTVFHASQNIEGGKQDHA